MTEAILDTPVNRNAEAKYKIGSFHVEVGNLSASIMINVQDSSNATIRSFGVNIPDSGHPTATVLGLNTAMMNVRATEAGGDAAKMQFRILGYLFDQGYLTGVTLVP